LVLRSLFVAAATGWNLVADFAAWIEDSINIVVVIRIGLDILDFDLAFPFLVDQNLHWMAATPCFTDHRIQVARIRTLATIARRAAVHTAVLRIHSRSIIVDDAAIKTHPN